MNTIRHSQNTQPATAAAGPLPSSPRASWAADRDEQFFRIVQNVFSARWLDGAGVLLASYDVAGA